MALTIIEDRIDLNVYDYDQTPPIIKACGDDANVRYVKAALYNGGDEYVVTANDTAELIALRPDNRVVIAAAECIVEEVQEPEYYEIYTEEIDGEEVMYYIDESGNQIYILSPEEAIKPGYVPQDRLDFVRAEIAKEITMIPGQIKCQFKIVSGNQIIRTSYFYVKASENLENRGVCVIDATT